MMDSMYSIMRRINEIRQRFQPPRQQAPETQEAERRTGFGIEMDRRIGEQSPETSPLEMIMGNDTRGDDGGGVEMTSDALRGMARDYAVRNRISPSLVTAVIETESSFNPRALSPRGAMGLMQLMPDTARELDVEDPFEPEQNIRGGVQLLRRLLDRYNGDYRMALAAYNAGEGAVARSGGVPDYPETQEYVRRVIGAYLRNSE